MSSLVAVAGLLAVQLAGLALAYGWGRAHGRAAAELVDAREELEEIKAALAAGRAAKEETREAFDRIDAGADALAGVFLPAEAATESGGPRAAEPADARGDNG